MAGLNPDGMERGLVCAPGTVPTFTAAVAAVDKIRFFKGAVKVLTSRTHPLPAVSQIGGKNSFGRHQWVLFTATVSAVKAARARIIPTKSFIDSVRKV